MFDGCDFSKDEGGHMGMKRIYSSTSNDGWVQQYENGFELSYDKTTDLLTVMPSTEEQGKLLNHWKGLILE